MTRIRIQPVVTENHLQEFIRLPWRIYAGDPNWVPPLISQMQKRLDVKRNPFFKHARRELFLAYRGQTVVGSVAAIDNEWHNEQLGERIGFFGFFESIDDVQVSELLLDAAAGWLRERGLKLMRGPFNGAPTDEAGVLISGRRRRPVMWTGHTPPYYQRLFEMLGFRKYDDLFAYEATHEQLKGFLDNLPPKLWNVAQRGLERNNAVLRQMDTNRWDEEVATAHALYNVAFRSIEGHIDMSQEKFMEMADAFRYLLDPRLALVVEVDGKAVGFAVALKDINEVLRRYNGRVYGLGKITFSWRLKRVQTVSVKLLGVLPEFRTRGLESVLMLELLRQVVENKYELVDMSLASEKNDSINRILQRMGADIYRRYRIYERLI